MYSTIDKRVQVLAIARAFRYKLCVCFTLEVLSFSRPRSANTFDILIVQAQPASSALGYDCQMPQRKITSIIADWIEVGM